MKREKASENFNKIRKTDKLNADEFYEEHQLENRWVRLEESIKEIRNFRRALGGLRNVEKDKLNFEVTGTSYNLKFERRMDKGYKKYLAVEKIERVWLGYKGRKIVKNIK